MLLPFQPDSAWLSQQRISYQQSYSSAHSARKHSEYLALSGGGFFNGRQSPGFARTPHLFCHFEVLSLWQHTAAALKIPVGNNSSDFFRPQGLLCCNLAGSKFVPMLACSACLSFQTAVSTVFQSTSHFHCPAGQHSAGTASSLPRGTACKAHLRRPNSGYSSLAFDQMAACSNACMQP